MSIKVMSAIWDRRDISGNDKLLLLSLADHADDEGVCYPSIRRLRERTGLSERSVQTIIKRLIDTGYLVVDYGAGRNGVNVFRIGIPSEVTPPQNLPPAESAPRKSCATPPQILPEPPAESAPKPSGTFIEPSERAPARKRAKGEASGRLSPSWRLPQEWGAWAKCETSLDDLTIRREADKFRDYWTARPGKEGMKLDWFATWRNWARRAEESQRPSPASSSTTDQQKRWASY